MVKIDNIPGLNPVETGNQPIGKNEVGRADKALNKGNVIDIDRDKYTIGNGNIEK